MSGYDFSHLFPANVLAFSPGTTFLAVAHQNRIIVRSTSTLQIVRTWECILPPEAQVARPKEPGIRSSVAGATSEIFSIDTLQWSGDSMYLLVHSRETKMAWVYGVAQEGEAARVGGMGVEGLSKVEWGKGDREVLAWTEIDSRLYIYNLCSGETRFIQNVKPSPDGYTYSPDSRYLAVTEKHLGKDCIGVYDILDGYSLLRHFPLLTIDVQGISWSPCGRYIAAWDSSLSYSLHIHSAIGPHLTHFNPSSPTFSLAPNEVQGLGLRTLAWAPGGRWIAVGGWDGKVRIIESYGWRCVCVVTCGTRANKTATVWREPNDWLRDTRGRGIVQFDRQPRPVIFPVLRPDITKPYPRMGISHLSFDREATLLLIRLGNQPNVAHIYSFLPTPTSEQLSVTHTVSAIFSREIKKAKWSPVKSKLSVVTSGGGVYFWDRESGWIEEESGGSFECYTEIDGSTGGMMEGVGIPTRAEFSALDIHWSPDGRSLAIQDRYHFCLLYDEDTQNLEDDEQAGGRSALIWDEQAEGLTALLEEDEEHVSLSNEVSREQFVWGKKSYARVEAAVYI
uniref:Uncharacterized protein n=1 Tax=Cryptococcus bacillisporus CA1280 TaxID=1296109 RepID=A0A0D0TPP5_CRYGA|nr:hypothetical protein I312_01711 [Cryptococcus bacillisporus CA1280]